MDNSVIKALQKKYGAAIIRLESDDSGLSVSSLSTGILSLDYSTGIGGIPIGAFTEIFAHNAVGKTTLAIQLAAQAQKNGLPVAYIDMEHKFNQEYASDLGLDLTEAYFTQPGYGEAALSITKALIESGEVKFVVVDSVSSLVPKAEIEGSIGDSLPGLQARMMSQSMRMLAGKVREQQAIVLFINQIRHKMGGGSFAGASETTSGGVALGFYAAMRIRLGMVKRLKSPSGDPLGQEVRAVMSKNSYSAPYRSTILTLNYGTGFDKYFDLLDVALDLGIIERAGAWYSYKEQKFQGRYGMTDAMREDSEMYSTIFSVARKTLGMDNEDTAKGK